MGKGGLLIPKRDRNPEIVESVLDRLAVDGMIKMSADRGTAFIAFPEDGVQVSDLFERYNELYSSTPTGLA